MSFSYFVPNAPIHSPANQFIKSATADNNKVTVSFIDNVEGTHYLDVYLKATRNVAPGDTATVYFDADIEMIEYVEFRFEQTGSIGNKVDFEGDRVSNPDKPYLSFNVNTYDGELFVGLNNESFGDSVPTPAGVQKYAAHVRFILIDNEPYVGVKLNIWRSGAWEELLTLEAPQSDFPELDGMTSMHTFNNLFIGAWQWFEEGWPVKDFEVELISNPVALLTVDDVNHPPLPIVSGSVNPVSVDYFTSYDFFYDGYTEVSGDGVTFNNGHTVSFYTRPLRKDLWNNGYDFGIYAAPTVPENFESALQTYSLQMVVGDAIVSEGIDTNKWHIDIRYVYSYDASYVEAVFRSVMPDGTGWSSRTLFHADNEVGVIPQNGDVFVFSYKADATRLGAQLLIKRGAETISMGSGELLWANYFDGETPSTEEIENMEYIRNNLQYKGVATSIKEYTRDEMVVTVWAYTEIPS